jgi:hypothetical protein
MGDRESWLRSDIYSKLHTNQIDDIGTILALSRRDLQCHFHKKAILIMTELTIDEVCELIEEIKSREWLDHNLCKQ